MATVLFEEQLEIPAEIRSLAEFRRWAVSDEFPERGRVDFVAGRIEVDMAPEDLFCHGTLKSELGAALQRLVKRGKLGHLWIDRARISSPEADLSAEPDVVFLSHEALKSGRARLVPKAGGRPGRYVEVEGPVDLVVEIVSDTSVSKDTKRLPVAYFRAGVGECWLADARGESVAFAIHRRGANGFEPVDRDSDGFQPSAVLGRSFRLDSTRDADGNWEFDLREKG
jgi:Uma2 family endonuclease